MIIDLETRTMVIACQKKDPEAFRVLVERYSEYAYGGTIDGLVPAIVSKKLKEKNGFK